MFFKRLWCMLCSSGTAFLISLILPGCLAAISFAHNSYAGDHAVVLQYHNFGDDTPPSTSVTMDQFRSHLEYIKEHKFNVLPLENTLELLRAGKSLPDNAVAITIDDANISVFERAYPLLNNYGYPFTVFVSTEGVERGMKHYMTWDQMKVMKTNGASFASHSHTHDYLIRRRNGETVVEWRSRVKNDIQTSLKLLKDNLGTDSKLFAYPYGEYNAALTDIVSELNLTGIGQHSGPVWSGSDFTALPRFPMAVHFADMEEFLPKIWSLPLPVVLVEPVDMELPEGVDMPVMRIKLVPKEYRPDSIECFASGQGRIKTRWIDQADLQLEVTAEKPLPMGRSRYNCTAAHKSGNRFYWYSHPWVRHSN